MQKKTFKSKINIIFYSKFELQKKKYWEIFTYFILAIRNYAILVQFEQYFVNITLFSTNFQKKY